MKHSIDAIKINGFDNFPGLVHASSPRYFKNDLGKMEQYDFAGTADLEIKSNHMMRFMETFEIKNRVPYLLNQIHSDRIFILKDPLQTCEQVSAIEADAIMTHLPEIPIGVFTADCIPVLLYDPRFHVVAAIHAGRKGTSQGIVNKTIMAMEQEYGCCPEDLIAGMGLGIGGCCYEVGEDCLQDFEKKVPFEPPFLKSGPKGKYFIDLYAVNEQGGINAGMRPENIFRWEECTFCSPMKHFSYRREGKTGRILTFIMLLAK